jgi:hypothetical protein
MNPNIEHPDIKSEKGSALIVAVMILLVVTVIGIIASRTANIELQIATHDKTHKMTWFATDAVVDGLVPELMEQAIDLRLTVDDVLSDVMPVWSDDLTTPTPAFYINEEDDDDLCVNCPFPDNADIVLSAAAMGQADVFVRVYGATGFLPGNALQLPEGYHGRGKGLASGGAIIIYDIRGLGQGMVQSESRISSRWRHVIR